MQVELKDQPPVAEQEQVDEQVQDAANVGYQKGLLPEEDTVEHQWRLWDKVMAAFNSIVNGYEQINKGFRALSQLIDGTPLHTMGKILNDIQESTANAAGYGEAEEGSDGGAEEGGGESSGEVGRGRKKGREGVKRKKGGDGDHDDDDNDQDKGCKIRKWKLNPKNKRQLTYRWTHLWHKNLDHHMT